MDPAAQAVFVTLKKRAHGNQYNDIVEFPKEWAYDKEKSLDYHINYMRDLKAANEDASLVTQSAFFEKDSLTRAYVRQYSPPGAPGAEKMMVCFVKGTRTRHVELGTDDEVAARREGFVPFVKDTPPVDFDDNFRDTRIINDDANLDDEIWNWQSYLPDNSDWYYSEEVSVEPPEDEGEGWGTWSNDGIEELAKANE